MARLEVRGAVVGAFLCVLSLAIFIYGMSTMTSANVVSNSFVIAVSVFLGITGLLVLFTNLFSRGFFST